MFLISADVKVYQQDLESSLHYSLRREIAVSGLIEGEQMAALKGYVKALVKVRKDFCLRRRQEGHPGRGFFSVCHLFAVC